ncbi:putative ABC transport system permease protein [Maribacter orientalis]|uniref:Putative ABC transport system permease protein n=1 Tax=Maribacter orientalis TaxID=228957 RepID=A0A1H7RQD5_9FLAO|nr:ABC transporter permease [Maribacter orientalis]SEL62385.1 putative ABC transport system permease protein [Maribacter orientalis]|tara:strand:+ start:626 stop:1843 length:1218 start_codon:yes stop_codon:yes gene_type:complete
MKRFFKIFKVAFESINKNRTRSLLTMLGIIIGVGAVIMTISAGEGATMQVENQISGLGTNLLMIQTKSEHKAGINVRMGRPIDKKDFDMLQKNSVWMPKLSPLVAIGAQAIGPDGYKSTTVYGVSYDYFYITSRELEFGSFFTEEDVKTAKKYCVIGETIREELFPGQDPVGKQIRIDKVPFTVVGLLREEGSGGMGQDMDDIVVAPYTTIQNRLFGHQRGYNLIVASAFSEDHIADAKVEATELLRESHKIKDGDEDDFEIMTQIELQEITGNITGILTILLGAIASISLIVGGIGIMNIMLVSVTERTREIGTRLAIGARESDILTQFLIEAIVLSLVGGVLGIILGIIGNQIIYRATDFYIPTAIYSILIGFGFSAMIGVAFGYFPARKAAKLNPIDALRYE